MKIFPVLERSQGVHSRGFFGPLVVGMFGFRLFGFAFFAIFALFRVLAQRRISIVNHLELFFVQFPFIISSVHVTIRMVFQRLFHVTLSYFSECSISVQIQCFDVGIVLVGHFSITAFIASSVRFLVFSSAKELGKFPLYTREEGSEKSHFRLRDLQ